MRVRTALVLSFLASGLLIACSSDSGLDVSGTEPLTDVLTLVLTFGDEFENAEDYLLAGPGMIAVTENNNIMVVDEQKVKVFSPTGLPQSIFGGEGQGPGEFENVYRMWLNPNGYLTVFGGRFGFTAHYFRPDRSFIERANFRSTNPYNHYLESLDLRSRRPAYVVARQPLRACLFH